MFEQAVWLERDFYGVRGLGTQASSREVTTAYRRGLHERGTSSELEAAYAMLGDAARRCEYDRLRAAVARGEDVHVKAVGGSRYNRVGFGPA